MTETRTDTERVLASVAVHRDATVKNIAEATGLSRPRVRKAGEALTESGDLIRAKYGAGHVYYTPENAPTWLHRHQGPAPIKTWISTNANVTVIARIERELQDAGFEIRATGRFGTVLVSETMGGAPCKTACDFREVSLHGGTGSDAFTIVEKYNVRTSRGGWTCADMASPGQMIAGGARIKDTNR